MHHWVKYCDNRCMKSEVIAITSFVTDGRMDRRMPSMSMSPPPPPMASPWRGTIMMMMIVDYYDRASYAEKVYGQLKFNIWSNNTSLHLPPPPPPPPSPPPHHVIKKSRQIQTYISLCRSRSSNLSLCRVCSSSDCTNLASGTSVPAVLRSSLLNWYFLLTTQRK